MSLSTALSNATSGLAVTSRAADIVSGNVANALTPGYARRELELQSQTLGALGMGVQVAGVTRVSDPLLIADRRVAEANASESRTLSAGLLQIEQAIGDPTDPGSLSALAAAFEASLVEAASTPDSEPRLTASITAARRLAQAYGDIGDRIQEVRTRADTAISGLVDNVNAAVIRIDRLNDQIQRLETAQGNDSSALLEQRQQLIDELSEIVPIREVPRANGAVALYTDGGAVLLDGRPRLLSFEAAGFVQPGMTLASGALSGLELDGRPVTTGENGLLRGGELAAQFALRDEAGLEAQAAIDALARDLVERYQDPALDPTIAAGGAGLFTDLGVAFDPANEEGLALRLKVNAAVDPLDGGLAWRLRDGVGAAAQGDAGQSDLITALADRFAENRSPASGPASAQPRSVTGQIAFVLSDISIARQSQDAETAFQTAKLTALEEQEAESGVDTDDEMQKLLLIEQAYGANARVIQTINQLFEELRRI